MGAGTLPAPGSHLTSLAPHQRTRGGGTSSPPWLWRASGMGKDLPWPPLKQQMCGRGWRRGAGAGRTGWDRKGQEWKRRRKVKGSKPRGITARRRGGSPRAPGPRTTQQHLDHFPAWPHLIFTPCRQNCSLRLITSEQAENVAEVGLLFLLLALHEVGSQLLMSLPSHNSFLSPVIVITWSPEFVLPSLSQHLGSLATAKAPCMQQAGETAVKHVQEYLKVSAASPLWRLQLGIKSFLTRKRLHAHKWQS